MSGSTELGDFLRARREALQPSDVGLVDNGRRRTPGLRREEVATLAGVSIDYLTRLEQGRDTNPSASVLHALAGALQLGEDERRHMGRLAVLGHSRELCPSAAPFDTEVSAGVRHLLDALDTTPAFVLGPLCNVVAWNAAWERVVAPLGLLDETYVNLAYHVFTHPRAREVYADWDTAADEQVARLRAAEPCYGSESAFGDLLAALRAADGFEARWSKHSVADKHRGTKTLRHPDADELHLEFEVLVLPDDDQQLITWRAADAATAVRLDGLLRDARPVSPPQLSVVVNR
jgi:transcriptional regulator with XRE-family HTH domain